MSNKRKLFKNINKFGTNVIFVKNALLSEEKKIDKTLLLANYKTEFLNRWSENIGSKKDFQLYPNSSVINEI